MAGSASCNHLALVCVFRRSRRSLRLLPFTLLLRRSARRASRHLFQLYLLLGSRQDIFHVDVMIHQVLVEGMVGLQSSNECGCSDIITTVINQYHLALKITDVPLKGLSLLHLDGEEVVVIILKLISRDILVEEGVDDLFKTPERPRWEEVEPV